MVPFAGDFLGQMKAICVVELTNAIDSSWILRNKCTLDQRGTDLLQSILGSERVYICDELSLRDPHKRILDSRFLLIACQERDARDHELSGLILCQCLELLFAELLVFENRLLALRSGFL